MTVPEIQCSFLSERFFKNSTWNTFPKTLTQIRLSFSHFSNPLGRILISWADIRIAEVFM